MIGALCAAWMIGQAVGWLVFYPESERLDGLYWEICLLKEG
jgi:hypothetical protein